MSTPENFCEICGNRMLPLTVTSNQKKGKNTTFSKNMTLFNEIAEILMNSDEDNIDLSSILKKHKQKKVNLFGVLETETYRHPSRTSEERERIYVRLYALLNDEQKKNKTLLKTLKYPSNETTVHYLVCANAHNVQRVKPKYVVMRRQYNRTLGGEKSTFKVQSPTIYGDTTYLRRNDFECPKGKKCGCFKAAVKHRWKPCWGKAMKIPEPSGRALWHCVPCLIDAHLEKINLKM